MDIEKAGLKLESNNKFKVNGKWQTNVNNIYAIGDIVQGNMELTPLAIKEGEYLSNGIFQDNWNTINLNYVPTTIFTPLEYSFVGLSEEQAIQKYGEDNVEIYHSNFTPLEWVFNEKEENQCYAKIIVQKKTDLMKGIHILSPNSGEII